MPTIRRKKQRNQTTGESAVGIVLDERECDELWTRLHALPEAFFKDEDAHDYGIVVGLLLDDQDPLSKLILEELEGMVALGYRTSNKNGELEEGWNTAPKPGQYEFQHPREWARMQELDGPAPKPDPVGRTEMQKLDPSKVGGAKNVYVKSGLWVAAANARLRIERKSTAKMRADLTENLNKRVLHGEAAVKKGVVDSCKMASALAGMLKGNKKLLEEGGLFFRIVGSVQGQGQHKHANPEAISKAIAESAERLKVGKGMGEDGNMVMQFIGCFVDGLTEVTEGKKIAKEQFDELWPQFRFSDDIKEKLLKRVEGYKRLAGAASDTLSGKSARKGDTRTGFMSDDPRKQLESTALIRNDLSGSMHSSLMAQEIAEGLFGDGKIKEMGAPVVLTDKNLVNARATDALALTAGGKEGEEDTVYHTAFEMINGMQGITGTPPVSQAMATEIMYLMAQDKSFTDAMELHYPGVDFPWRAKK